MKLRNPTLIRLVAFLASVLIRGWMSTLRLRLVFQDGRVHPTDPRVERFIYAFWHESLLAPTVRRTRVHILISQHADGEFIAQVCRFLGYGVVRGSSTRGGSLALLELMDRCTRSHLAVTPDGPRGPRRQVKVGIVYLASRTGMAIVPVGVGYTRAWRFRSWDRFAVPHPFSTVVGVLGPAVRVPAGLDRDGLERYRRLVEECCLAATSEAERRAARLGGGSERPVSTGPCQPTARRQEGKACA
ncbi:MAG TPA: lysophospholipid acyltransferase family protein [Gemmataceae bacterium]|nr:lysophospholipid acyltransferase family protein [Gemmataceae bacterium]